MDSNTIVAHEQAFSQAGNWGEGKPKRPVDNCGQAFRAA